MTNAHQSPAPFAHRLTPEVRKAWETHLAANRKAASVDTTERDQRFFKCPCGKYTDRPSGMHKKCEEVAV